MQDNIYEETKKSLDESRKRILVEVNNGESILNRIKYCNESLLYKKSLFQRDKIEVFVINNIISCVKADYLCNENIFWKLEELYKILSISSKDISLVFEDIMLK